MMKVTNEVVAGALRECNGREMLETVFSQFEVDDYAVRIQCLTLCMGNPKTFFSAGEESSLELKYELTVQMFLTGAWKMALKYFSGVQA